MHAHQCPHCNGVHHASSKKTKHHQCMQCGGSFFSSLMDTVKKVASNPMVQGLVKAAAPQLLSAVQHYAPGLSSKATSLYNSSLGKAAQRAVASPMGQSMLSTARKQIGLGRRRHGAAYPLGQVTPGESAYATMRSPTGHGRHRKPRGGFGLPGPLGMVTGMLGPLGDLISGPPPPPPPPPHATFQSSFAGPTMAARPHGIGRGKSKMVHHACPHCGGVHSARHSTQKHKCKMCGGSFFSSLMDTVKKVASNPMVQGLVKAAAPQLLNAVHQYAPGLASKATSLYNSSLGKAAQRAVASPMGQSMLSSARKQIGLGKRTRAPTAHSKAVGHVMRETGMGLSAASKHVKHHGLARHFA